MADADNPKSNTLTILIVIAVIAILVLLFYTPITQIIKKHYPLEEKSTEKAVPLETKPNRASTPKEQDRP